MDGFNVMRSAVLESYEAKGLVRHGEWLDWVAVNCRFSDRAAQFYMQVYRANPQGISDLTLTDAIKQIEQLKSPPEPNERMISGGRPGRGKRDPVADAIKLDPTAVLEKAWAQAGEIERIAFANKIQKDLQPKQ